jgi:CheY-like chemotaxis protein
MPAPPMSTPSSHPILLVAEAGEGRLLRRALERAGHAVLHRPTGVDAAEWLEHSPLSPSLILVDWNPRGGDSTRLLARLSGDPRLATVPVVVLSDIAHMRSVPSRAVTATLARPVRSRTLVDVIDRLLGRPKRTVLPSYPRWTPPPEPLDDSAAGTPRTVAIRVRPVEPPTLRMAALDEAIAAPHGIDDATVPTLMFDEVA